MRLGLRRSLRCWRKTRQLGGASNFQYFDFPSVPAASNLDRQNDTPNELLGIANSVRGISLHQHQKGRAGQRERRTKRLQKLSGGLIVSQKIRG